MSRLQGKVAFVTGVARGQGRAHAVRMAAEGASVIGVDICENVATVAYDLASEADLAETERQVREAGGEIVAIRGDVRERDDLTRALQAGLARFGRLDVVVANAGVATHKGPEQRTHAAWTVAIDIMLTGVWQTLEVCIPTLVEQGHGGSIVITSSSAGLKGLYGMTLDGTSAGFAGYVAAKHGVVGLMRHYAGVLGPHSIRVNTVHPSGVATPMIMNDATQAWIAQNPGLGDHLATPLPVGGALPAGDITNAVVWLASDDARYVTGVTLPVDGGYSIK